MKVFFLFLLFYKCVYVDDDDDDEDSKEHAGEDMRPTAMFSTFVFGTFEPGWVYVRLCAGMMMLLSDKSNYILF